MTMDLALTNHLFLTPRFVVKGNARTGDLRLSSFLNSVRRPWLVIDHATLIDTTTQDRIATKQATLRLADVIFAHEYLDLGGDPLRKKLAQTEQHDFRMLSLYFKAPCRLEMLGRVRHDAMDPAQGDDFLVVMEPLVRGFAESDSDEVKALKELTYAIVNRSQVHGFFQYE